MKSTLDVHRDLLAKGVAHEVVQLPRLITTAEELPDVLGVAACAVVRLYVTGTSMIAVVLLAGTVTRPSLLRTLLGPHRLATATEVNIGTGYAAGLVGPLCLPADIPVLADAALGRHEVLYTTAGEGGVALGIRTRDLLVACDARIASLSAPPAFPQEDELVDTRHRVSLVRRSAR